MRAYRIIAYKDDWRVDQVVEAEDDLKALRKFSEQVDAGEVKITENSFTKNDRVHITYEELK
jgi:hypothetical protein|tara:strand:- start:389 stop:574 length:186 start_codon:yes stop_codon:yes gene_type:complete